jgi:electron transfer flavoprotein alpha subunit
MSVSKIWVVAEAANGKVSTSTLELLTAARATGATVEAVIGADGAAVAAELGAFGATKVYATGDLGGSLLGVPVASAIAALVGAGNAPDLILVAQTYDGRDIAGRLSVKLNQTVLTNGIGVSVDGGSIVVDHAVFGGAKIVKASFTGAGPHIVLVRPKSYAAETAGAGAAAVEAVAVGETGATGGATITERHVEERTGPKLDEARVVVSGGRGLGEAGKYSMVEDLAKVLKGAPGASRAIVDAGWVPYAYQVGQTGKTVKPEVYIAAGISGATQHMVGMKGAKNIIAINKDKEAPIFGIADLGIVGDVHKVLPKLLEALQQRS